MLQPFVVLSDDGRAVQAWSVARFQFDGRGWQRQLRDELRTALEALPPASEDQVLHAIYEAPDDGAFSDAENVLLYNVGSRYLRHLVTRGVRFERAYVRPDPPIQVLSQPALHRHRYSLAELTAGFTGWRAGELLAQFDDVALSKLDKPGPVWAAIRTQSSPPAVQRAAPVRFTISVNIAGPESRPGLTRSVADLVKPLLDGIICAYHRDSTSPPDAAAARLSAAGLGASDELVANLANPVWAALGPVRLVKPFGVSGVQWNPADDYCVAAEVVLDPTPSAGGWRISGRLNAAV